MFEDMDIEMYIISKDKPEEQLQLYNALQDRYGYSLPFVSDPNLKLIDAMGMKNDEVAHRGYGIMDQEGNILFNTINDHWGEQVEATAEKVKEEYEKLK
ncbi:redoxin domain-containing protein [Salirhabdus salicampi]|nr:redoxin domain-containing protein [Salirhabdus salicampi]